MILIATFTDKIIENIENNKNQSHEILSYRFLGFYKTLTQFLMSFIAASYFLTHVSTVRYNKYLDINNWDQSFRCWTTLEFWNNDWNKNVVFFVFESSDQLRSAMIEFDPFFGYLFI